MVLTQWETLCGLFFAFFEKIVVPILTSGGLTEVMRPLSTSSQSITRIKKTSNIMLPAKPMVTAAWMRASLRA